MTIAAARSPILAVSTAVFDAHGRVLLIRRANAPNRGLWTLPGGRLELGETLFACAAREVQEETGVVCKVASLVDALERSETAGESRYHYVILTFVATGQGIARAASDAAEARWVAEDEFGPLATTEGLGAVVSLARRILTSIPRAADAN